MRWLRRFGGTIVLLLSAAGIIGCAGGIIGIWMCYRGVSEKVQTIAARLDTALERVSTADQNVLLAIERARADLATARKDSADLDGGSEKGRRASRGLRTVIQHQAGPNIDEVGGRLATLSDAAVAVSSLLESFQELPTGPRVGVEPDLLKRRAEEARHLSASLRRLDAALDDGDKGPGGREAVAATSEVDLVLQKCQETVADWQSDLDAVREDLSHLKTEVLGWLWPAAVAVTFLVGWMGVGQVSLFAHALQWCRGG